SLFSSSLSSSLFSFLLLSYFFFFFLIIRPPPRSTPFPTRRSSDLWTKLDALAEPSDLGGRLSTGHETLDRDPAAFLQLDVRRILDRKSTRLNSSHVEISYAVFCLKKKKKTTTDIIKPNNKYTNTAN